MRHDEILARPPDRPPRLIRDGGWTTAGRNASLRQAFAALRGAENEMATHLLPFLLGVVAPLAGASWLTLFH
jgi:hypothetical protein